MADILLITDQQLTKYSPIGGNVDIDKYRMLVKEVQEFVIEPILGTKLYNKILTDYNANNLTGAYSAIYTNYLQWILIHKVAAEYIALGGIDVDNAGIFTRLPEETTPASASQIQRLEGKLNGKADVYVDRLQRYLRDQGGSITEYTYNQDNNYDIDPDKSVTNYSGWRLAPDWETMGRAQREIWKDIWSDEGKA